MGKLSATVTKLRTHMGRKKYEKEKKRTRGLITPKKEGGIKRKGGNYKFGLLATDCHTQRET